MLFLGQHSIILSVNLAHANPNAPNMALTVWEGAQVRKADVCVAKNYLSANEVDTLNRLVLILLEQAELRLKERKDLTLDYWRKNVDRLIAFSDKPLWPGQVNITPEQMKLVVHERYGAFKAKRRLIAKPFKHN